MQVSCGDVLLERKQNYNNVPVEEWVWSSAAADCQRYALWLKRKLRLTSHLFKFYCTVQTCTV